MRLANGCHLYSAQRYLPLLQDVWYLAKAVLHALSVLHAKKICHRDIRLPNIVTIDGQEGRYKLIDMEHLAHRDAKWPPMREGLLDWDEDTLEWVRHPLPFYFSGTLRLLF